MNQEEKQYQTKEFRVIADFLSSITSKLGQVKRVDSMLSSALTDIDDLRRRINSLDQSINITYEAGMKLENEFRELKTRFDNHEINILPRFKEEILMCLEDDEFRIKVLDKLIPKMYQPLFNECFKTTAETPQEKRFGTCFDNQIILNNKYLLNQSFNSIEDANKTIEKAGDFANPKAVYIKDLEGWFIPND